MKASVRPRLARAFFTIVLILLGTALAVTACVRQTRAVGAAGRPAPAASPTMVLLA